MTRLSKCVYYRQEYPRKQLAHDHVIAGAWYPRTTSTSVQRLTVLACRDCNTNRYSADERYLLLRLSACVDPDRVGAHGVRERARPAMDVQTAQTSGNGSTGRQHGTHSTVISRRLALRRSKGCCQHLFQTLIWERGHLPVYRRKGSIVVEKWALGFHNHICGEAAEVHTEVSTFHLKDTDAADIFSFAKDRWTVIERGPGIRVRYIRGGDETERHTVYEFQVCGRVMALASIREGNGPPHCEQSSRELVG
jgi:hypothetical protein